MTLYDINSAILACMTEVVDPETGEITEEVFDQDLLDGLKIQQAEKVDNLACWYKNQIAEAEAIKAEAAKLLKRAKSAERKADFIKNYLAYNCAGQRFKGIRSDVQFRITKSVAVDDLQQLPEQFLKIKTTVDPDKVALKKALQGGEKIPGAHLESGMATIIK